MVPGYRLFNLTKKGRLLRRLGSYSAYQNHIEQKAEIEQLQRDYIRAQAENIKWQNQLVVSQIQTNSNVITTNRRVLIILVVTVLVAVISIIPPSIALKRDIDKDKAKDTVEQQRNKIKSLELKSQEQGMKLD